jgi:hypothetical protein
MQNFEIDILANLITEFKEIEAEELGEAVISFFGGLPTIYLENKFGYVSIYGNEKEIILGFGEQGGNGQRSMWSGQLYWQLTEHDTHQIEQGEIANGSPFYVLHKLFEALTAYLEEKGN